MTSRHRRPEQRLPFQLTTRDNAVLASVYRHRFLTADHVRALHFAASSLRVCQVRLQRMWAGRYLDRLYLPPEQPDARDRWTERPIYSLAMLGAEVVAGKHELDVRDVPHTAVQNRNGFTTLRHHMVFTDVAVAVEAWRSAAVASELSKSAVPAAPTSAVITREQSMRAALQREQTTRPVPSALVPDGAVTLSDSAQPAQTYLVEVVRAGVKSGNDTIRRRLWRYRSALRAGFFRDVYGFAWVRAVVFITPTLRRAEHLAALARGVTGGERLFRFGAYESRVGVGAPTSTLRPDTIATPILMTPSGRRVPFLDTISITSIPSHV